jgi:very-short-patch-repair endonuclease
LIEHAIDPSSLMNQLNAGLVKTESPFEAEVFKILSGHGYRVTPQWQVGAYRIDMVAEGNGKRLAIECDGERWHYDKAEEDLARQALLERLGWSFVRIRGSVFYRDKTQGRQVALIPLFQRFKELGIEAKHESNSPSSEGEKHTLADTVKQKAAEIRSRAAVPIGQTISIEAVINAVEPSSIAPQALPEPSTQSKQMASPVQVPLFIPKVQESSTNESSTLTQRTVQFVRGDRVFNQKFGLGTVLAIKQYGGQVRELVIDFDFLPEEKTLVVTAVQLA